MGLPVVDYPAYDEAEAQQYIQRFKDDGEDLALRCYTSNLIGKQPSLVRVCVCVYVCVYVYTYVWTNICVYVCVCSLCMSGYVGECALTGDMSLTCHIRVICTSVYVACVYVYACVGVSSSPPQVLHGGGNTSVKSTATNKFGENVDVLCVKGNG